MGLEEEEMTLPNENRGPRAWRLCLAPPPRPIVLPGPTCTGALLALSHPTPPAAGSSCPLLLTWHQSSLSVGSFLNECVPLGAPYAQDCASGEDWEEKSRDPVLGTLGGVVRF